MVLKTEPLSASNVDALIKRMAADPLVSQPAVAWTKGELKPRSRLRLPSN